MASPQRASGLTLWSALGTVYLVWGSTYLAIAFAVESLPPLLSAGIRFLTAGILICLWFVLRGLPLRATFREIAGSATVGLFLLLGGNGVVVGVLRGEAAHLDPASFSVRSLVALAYLVVFGSIVAFTAYTWLLQHAPVSLVATYAFVNPVVAVILGALFRGEPITPAIVAGAFVIVTAVAFILWRQQANRAASQPQVAAAAD